MCVLLFVVCFLGFFLLLLFCFVFIIKCDARSMNLKINIQNLKKYAGLCIFTRYEYISNTKVDMFPQLITN